MYIGALIEEQFPSMRSHAERFEMLSPPKLIIVTGKGVGKSYHFELYNFHFGCHVYTIQSLGR